MIPIIRLTAKVINNVTFDDDCSKYCDLYLIKSENEVFDKFDQYKSEAENLLDHKLKKLRSDTG